MINNVYFLYVESENKTNKQTHIKKQAKTCSRVIPEKSTHRWLYALPETSRSLWGPQGPLRPEPQYTELLRMPQQSTMLRIISKICREGTGRQAVRTRGPWA